MKIMKIKELRQMRGLTQQKLADRVGVIRTVVANWESELTLPRARQLPKLAAALGVSISDLFCDVEPEHGACE